MLLYELALVLGMRGIHITSGLKKKDLEDMFLTPITDKEIDNIRMWNELSKHPHIINLVQTEYVEYIGSELNY